MARIEGLSLHRLSVPLRRPFVTAIRSAVVVDVLLVQVRDSDGRSGWGEAPTSWRVTGESADSVSAALSGPLIDAVRGVSTDDVEGFGVLIERAVVQNSAARMALDCALYDLAAQARAMPLAQFLGGTRTTARTDMTLSAAVTPSDRANLVQHAVECVADGFSTLKVKVGAGGDDVNDLIEIRRAVGEHVRLRADANQSWSRERAIRIISALEDAGVGLEFVEQPVDRDDIEGLALVAAAVETPVMVDESVWTSRDLREVIRLGAADMINIKLAKTGGLRAAMQMATLARNHAIGVIVGCMAESHVGISAAATLASVLDANAASAPAHDLDGGLLLTYSPVVGGVTYRGDLLELSEKPGLGITSLATN